MATSHFKWTAVVTVTCARCGATDSCTTENTGPGILTIRSPEKWAQLELHRSVKIEQELICPDCVRKIFGPAVPMEKKFGSLRCQECRHWLHDNSGAQCFKYPDCGCVRDHREAT